MRPTPDASACAIDGERCDVILQLGTLVWGKVWEEGILKEARRVLGEKMDAKEKAMGEKAP